MAFIPLDSPKSKNQISDKPVRPGYLEIADLYMIKAHVVLEAKGLYI
ncbi:MAG: hypothetical protein HOB02_09130 [Proteobacteria bacterium]|nr:hypothetical protein [Pseudomonadota bacterium]MBT7562972.1 hypothetical protein [Pseudomonadota bacterium]MBT7625904.1 hypothetical protein [Pseudomonadota bacterium]